MVNELFEDFSMFRFVGECIRKVMKNGNGERLRRLGGLISTTQKIYTVPHIRQVPVYSRRRIGWYAERQVAREIKR